MTELERREGDQAPAQQQPDFHAPSGIDEWVLVIRDVSRLASQIADTDFVPESMRGNPAAVTAAILSGREAGVGPMTALQHIHLVKGKPGQSAQLMRQLTLAAGHQIRYIETTDSRCVVEGRRRGEEQWERVTFTADQAKRAKIDLGGYPEDKLLARATTRLCRRKFADAIGGVSTSIEELEDGADIGAEPTAAPEPAANTQPAKRTARRKTATKTQPKPAQPEPEPQPAEEPSGPPLPGEDGADDEPTATVPELGDDPEQISLDEAQPSDPDAPITDDYRRHLFALIGKFGFADDRDERLSVLSTLVNQPLSSAKELTVKQASGVIDLLERMLQHDDAQQRLDLVLAEMRDSEHQS